LRIYDAAHDVDLYDSREFSPWNAIVQRFVTFSVSSHNHEVQVQVRSKVQVGIHRQAQSTVVMTLAALRYKLGPYGQAMVGQGAYVSHKSVPIVPSLISNEQSIVYKATEEGSGRQVAVKKSRVSRKVKRPTLQHETRVLQILRGNPSIPLVYGYGQLEHFEYMAMELLGPSIAEQRKDGAGVMVNTVIRVVDQAVRRIRIRASRST
jgi:hypothetical protein